jgi:hypothetical protein
MNDTRSLRRGTKREDAIIWNLKGKRGKIGPSMLCADVNSMGKGRQEGASLNARLYFGRNDGRAIRRTRRIESHVNHACLLCRTQDEFCNTSACLMLDLNGNNDQQDI